jgi:hypothetical protein
MLDRITRRKFALGAAATATAALLPAREVLAQAAPQPSPAQSPADPMSKLSPAARAEVEMKANDIFRKYGSRLSEDQKADIRRILAENQDGLEKMRSFALANSDQPAIVWQIVSTEKGE